MAKCPAHELSRKNLKGRGYVIDTAESYNAFIKRRKDLYHFIDIVGLHLNHTGVLAVQATSKSNLSARVNKAEALDAYHMWLACGNPVEFHGWHKPKHRWELKLIVVNPPRLFLD